MRNKKIINEKQLNGLRLVGIIKRVKKKQRDMDSKDVRELDNEVNMHKKAQCVQFESIYTSRSAQ